LLSKLRPRLTYANVVSTLCLFIVLGGGAYAASTITGKNVKNSSLTGRDIRNSSLTTGDVKNRSLLAKDFRTGQLPAGAQGPQGPQGDAGPKGDPATALWAMVNSDGTLKRGRGVVDVDPFGSRYEVTFDRSVENCTYLSTLTSAGNGRNNFSSPPEGQSNAALGSLAKLADGLPGAESVVTVETADSAGVGTPFDFNLAVFC
jgi:hypothetical protein